MTRYTCLKRKPYRLAEGPRKAPAAMMLAWRSKRLVFIFLRFSPLAYKGYYNYYGVKGNFEGLNEFHQEAMRILLKWLNRRSQKKSFNWEGFKEMLKHFKIPRPQITKHKRTRQEVALAKC